MKDFNAYAALGVSPQATTDDIRRAWKALALANHPDRNPDNPHAQQRMREINEAWAILRDPARRDLHDLMLEQRRRFGALHDRTGRPQGGVRLMPWEMALVETLLRISVWFYLRGRRLWLNGWFWLSGALLLVALFVLTWPASLWLALAGLVLFFIFQMLLLFYIYVRCMAGRE